MYACAVSCHSASTVIICGGVCHGVCHHESVQLILKQWIRVSQGGGHFALLFTKLGPAAVRTRDVSADR
jgi:hypothetical protein